MLPASRTFLYISCSPVYKLFPNQLAPCTYHASHSKGGNTSELNANSAVATRMEAFSDKVFNKDVKKYK